MINASEDGPYGRIDADDLTESEVHRIIQQKRPPGYKQRLKIIDGSVREVSGKLDPIEDRVIQLEEHNRSIVEGLFVNSTPSEDESDYIDLSSLRNKLAQKEYKTSSTTAFPPPTIDNSFDDSFQNVVELDPKDIEACHETTSKMTDEMVALQKRHLSNLLSFDNSSSYLEAFARDGLRLKSELEVEDSPIHFISNLCSVEVISSYLDKSNLSPAARQYYLEHVMDYFIERSKVEATTSRNQKYLRHHKSKIQGQVAEDTNASGALVSRK